jgi:DNA-binding MarR family transcriptional regulator
MPRRNPGPPQRPAVAPRDDSRRTKILDYLAGQGGELRSDTGVGLRRQIADALGERPTAVGQSLISLERAGLVNRELDIRRQRCYAIRLTQRSAPLLSDHLRDDDLPWDFELSGTVEPEGDRRDPRQRLADDLDAARQELKDAILMATKVSRRVKELEWALWRANQRQSVST